MTDTHTGTAVALLSYILFAALVHSAPVGSGAAPPSALREVAERAKTLVEKIERKLPVVHDAVVSAEGLTFDPSAQAPNLQLMVTSLGIPAPPVIKQLSEHFTLDMCVSRMLAGGRLYQGLLGVLSEQVGGLTELSADIRDLLIHVRKMKEVGRLIDDNPDQNPSLDLGRRLHGNYEVQVAVHLTLTQLRSFCHDLIRSLRAIART
ncbi:hypothetical protein INR49_007066 [Caranx melampygus]|nr:hypothetical protein INR49_007066 [Caranx melampygus]